MAAATGQLADELTVAARKPGFAELLAWGRGLDAERVWAIEDCRHVSGALERFPVAAAVTAGAEHFRRTRLLAASVS